MHVVALGEEDNTDDVRDVALNPDGSVIALLYKDPSTSRTMVELVTNQGERLSVPTHQMVTAVAFCGQFLLLGTLYGGLHRLRVPEGVMHHSSDGAAVRNAAGALYEGGSFVAALETKEIANFLASHGFDQLGNSALDFRLKLSLYVLQTAVNNELQQHWPTVFEQFGGVGSHETVEAVQSGGPFVVVEIRCTLRVLRDDGQALHAFQCDGGCWHLGPCGFLSVKRSASLLKLAADGGYQREVSVPTGVRAVACHSPKLVFFVTHGHGGVWKWDGDELPVCIFEKDSVRDVACLGADWLVLVLESGEVNVVSWKVPGFARHAVEELSGGSRVVAMNGGVAVISGSKTWCMYAPD